MATRAPVARFKGLNNVSDPLRLGLQWLQRADDVLITDGEALVRRQGYAQVAAGVMHGAYSTLDFKRLYIVNGTSLQRVNADMTLTTLRTVAALDMHWTEVNKTVYFTNGVDSGIILGDDSVIPWSWTPPTAPRLTAGTGSLAAGRYQVAVTFVLPDGRETGTNNVASVIDLPANSSLQISGIEQAAGMQTLVYIAPADSAVFGLAFQTASTAETWNSGPDYLGAELRVLLQNPLPATAIYPTLWKGQLHVAQYLPEQDVSVVWASEPLGFHLFDLDDSFFMVPGRVCLMAATPEAMVVGTDTKIYSFDGELKTLAEYGVVPGCGWALDDDSSVVFWSKRGACRALPFENLTEGQVSVAPGVSAGAAIVRRNGQKHFIVALRKGDAAFNHR